MRFKVLLSILLFIVTTLSAVHELEHITQQDDSSCMVYHVNDKLTSIDIVNEQELHLFDFEYIIQNNQVLNLHVKNKSNPNRAPPLVS